MKDFSRNVISGANTIRDALLQLNTVPDRLILFVIDEDRRLVGTLTDGDIRRAFISGRPQDDKVSEIMHTKFRYLTENFTIQQVNEFRKVNIRFVPLLDNEQRILKVIDLHEKRALLPLDVVLMAGGRGERLMPLTAMTPKPMLKIGDKPIIEHNIDRLISYGIDQFHITIKYLGEEISKYFGDGSSKDVGINYIKENEPLGTIGGLSLIERLRYNYVLVMNSDLVTNIDFEDFFCSFIESGADMSVATIPYKVPVPYAILELENDRVVQFKEKPTYTYYANAGIYLFKRETIDLVPQGVTYNATDLMEELIRRGKQITTYTILGYWMDVGRPEDFYRVQQEISHIKF